MTPKEVINLYSKVLGRQRIFTQQALAWPVDETGRAIETQHTPTPAYWDYWVERSTVDNRPLSYMRTRMEIAGLFGVVERYDRRLKRWVDASDRIEGPWGFGPYVEEIEESEVPKEMLS